MTADPSLLPAQSGKRHIRPLLRRSRPLAQNGERVARQAQFRYPDFRGG